MDRYQLTAKLFKALMHPARLAIIEVLRESEHCVCHLESQLGLRQAYISQQLAILRDAGLVLDRREGWNIYYHSLVPEIYELLDIAVTITTRDKNNQSLVFEKKMNRKPCSCPKCSPSSETADIMVQSIGQEER